MPFPAPQPSIETLGPQHSSTDLANDAAADRRAEQVRYALTQQAQTPMIRTIDQPMSEQELSRQRNTRLRLAGNDVHAYRSHLAAIDEEQTNIRIALESARRSADEALRAGHVHDVKKFRARIEDLNIEVDRMEVLAEEARSGLAQAERQEAARLVALEASLPEAEAKLRAWAKVQTEYTKLAARIAEIVGMEAEAEAAYATLRKAAQLIEGRELPAPFPTQPGGRALRVTVVLPGHCHPPVRPSSPNDAYAR